MPESQVQEVVRGPSYMQPDAPWVERAIREIGVRKVSDWAQTCRDINRMGERLEIETGDAARRWILEKIRTRTGNAKNVRREALDAMYAFIRRGEDVPWLS